MRPSREDFDKEQASAVGAADHAAACLDQLDRYAAIRAGRLLEIGCGKGELLAQARALGFEVAGQEARPNLAAEANTRLGRKCVEAGRLSKVHRPAEGFDACVVTHALERTDDPVGLLTQVRRLVKPGGVVLLTTTLVDTRSARRLERRWRDLPVESEVYFSRATIENALAKAGFEQIRFLPGGFRFRRSNGRTHTALMPPPASPLGSPAVRLGRGNPRGTVTEAFVLARSVPSTSGQRVSIVVPAYNEVATFTEVMEALLTKELPGLQKEIVVVESNSTDGTREAALRFGEHPEVRLVFEDRPFGKGHAVRAGLAEATGEFVMIQDADLEYDFNDYESLLKPLLTYRTAFVLGIRHGSAWKMRQFADNPMLAGFMNLGHILFTGLLNLLYGQKLKDPFTMFKLFRRDCLFGLRFESNRFDFDHELVIKLLRKGYQPLEIPVNYNSRSFSQGKKVRILRDPLTWLWALVKFRFTPLFEGADRIKA